MPFNQPTLYIELKDKSLAMQLDYIFYEKDKLGVAWNLDYVPKE